MRVHQLLKTALAHSPLPYSARLDAVLRLPLLHQWIRAQPAHPRFPTREQLYAHLTDHIIGVQPITFLEFGVHRGKSMTHWLRLNTQPTSTFVGFDSFEGLPETWETGGQTLKAGTFSTNGVLPDISDPRAHFVKGWFTDTLIPFLRNGFAPPHRQLVIHCDADLYSSTLFALCTLHPYLVLGTILIFDDFSSILNEFRALEDYTHAFGQHVTLIGAADGRSYYKHVAVRITAPHG